jgi:DNA transposition AAA+ family ATPase
MENIKKTNIVNALRVYVERYESQNRAAQSLKNLSAATLTQMLTGKWDLISDEMWRNVASQIGYRDERWEAAETANYQTLMTVLADAKANSLTLGITGNAGSGKTFTCRQFAASQKNAYHLVCNEYWHSKLFLSELLGLMGRDSFGMSINEMICDMVRSLKTKECPLIIIDEADKLRESVLHLFISLYNELEDDCGIILIATNHLEKRLQMGVKYNKRGYNELWSRLGRKCFQLKGISAADIVAVCELNGITERRKIDTIIADSESDLRRVKRKVHSIKKSQEARAKKQDN